MSGAIDWDSVREGRAAGQAPALKVAELLQCTPRVAAREMAHHLGLECWETSSMSHHEPAFDRLPIARAQVVRAVLFNESTGPGYVAVVHDPLDRDLWTQLAHCAQGPVRFVLASPEDIHAYLNLREAHSRAVDSLPASTQKGEHRRDDIEELSLAGLADIGSPAVKLVKSMLYDGLRACASDIHVESTPTGLTVKYRIDGILDVVTSAAGNALAEQAISRLKVLAELDIAERRVPQDGSFRVSLQGREVDLRLSVMPGTHGEDAVIRILDKHAMLQAHGKLTLDTLGFDPASVGALRELVEAGHGMLLVTGPTGSGKTTTLYAALSEAHTGHDKIITIEDPVEYHLAGVLQIPVNEKKGLTFARGLRSILRHDPDKIMVGEIRDRETAEIAVQSALTGHLVLTTVHANNVFDVFGRFTHMGLDLYSLMSALNGIWTQRLVRLNCPHCSRDHVPDAREMSRLRLVTADGDRFNFRRGEGCGDCRGTGYKGRQAIAEILRLDDELREMIVTRQPVRQVKEAAYRKGMRTLSQAGLEVVRSGRTTLEEIRRVAVAA